MSIIQEVKRHFLFTTYDFKMLPGRQARNGLAQPNLGHGKIYGVGSPIFCGAVECRQLMAFSTSDPKP